jgi:hypothetical protein
MNNKLLDNYTQDKPMLLSKILEKWDKCKKEHKKVPSNFGYAYNLKTCEGNNKIIGFGNLTSPILLFPSNKEKNTEFVFKFGNDKEYSDINIIKEKITNISNIGCILYFFDLETNRIKTNEKENMTFLRYGFHDTNNIDFWNKLIIVFYNCEKIRNVYFGNLTNYNPKDNGQSREDWITYKKEYDSIYVKNYCNAIKKYNEMIVNKENEIKKGLRNMCISYLRLPEDYEFKSIVLNKNSEYVISDYIDSDCKKKFLNFKKNDFNDNSYTLLTSLVKEACKTKKINCEIVNTQDITIKINDEYNIGTKLKRSYKLITAWFVTILCLNILVGFSTNNFNNRPHLTIPVCGVFDMIAFYYRKKIVQIIYPCLYKYIKNETVYHYCFYIKNETDY